MPELPDVEAYLVALRKELTGQVLRGVRLKSPFLLRSVDPPLSELVDQRVLGFERLGKRIVFAFEHELFCVLHLMIAGRLRWRKPAAGLPGRMGLAAFDFDSGALIFTEAGSKRRAGLWVVRGRDELARHDPGGIAPLTASADEFRAALEGANHTLKRALTDPGIFSGIGNAYSDEILFRARLSPFLRTRSLADDDRERLRSAVVEVLTKWADELGAEAARRFPEKVTAFRQGMAVHGRYGQPCPDCGAPVQRIVYVGNEANYCAACQTGGRLLADRALSRLLKDDWPRTLEELEARDPRKAGPPA